MRRDLLSEKLAEGVRLGILTPEAARAFLRPRGADGFDDGAWGEAGGSIEPFPDARAGYPANPAGGFRPAFRTISYDPGAEREAPYGGAIQDPLERRRHGTTPNLRARTDFTGDLAALHDHLAVARAPADWPPQGLQRFDPSLGDNLQPWTKPPKQKNGVYQVRTPGSKADYGDRKVMDTSGVLVVVVGGGGDSISRIAAGTASEYSHSIYFGRGDVNEDDAIAKIQQAAQGRPIVLIGHSWGGPEAHKVASRLERYGDKVALLVTADAASRFFGAGPSPTARWVNLDAQPNGRWNLSDVIGKLGGKPPKLDTSLAEINAVVPAHHENLGTLLEHRIYDPQVDGARSVNQMILDLSALSNLEREAGASMINGR